MTRMFALATVFTLGTLAVGGAYASASADSVRIGVNIGVPAPVIVAPAPPVVAAPIVITPGAPIYFYGGSYYSSYNGVWVVGGGHAGPWRHFSGPAPWERHRGGGRWREGHWRGPKHW